MRTSLLELCKNSRDKAGKSLAAQGCASTWEAGCFLRRKAELLAPPGVSIAVFLSAPKVSPHPYLPGQQLLQSPWRGHGYTPSMPAARHLPDSEGGSPATVPASDTDGSPD